MECPLCSLLPFIVLQEKLIFIIMAMTLNQVQYWIHAVPRGKHIINRGTTGEFFRKANTVKLCYLTTVLSGSNKLEKWRRVLDNNSLCSMFLWKKLKTQHNVIFNEYILPAILTPLNCNKTYSFLDLHELFQACVLWKSQSIIFTNRHYLTICGKFGLFWQCTLF